MASPTSPKMLMGFIMVFCNWLSFVEFFLNYNWLKKSMQYSKKLNLQWNCTSNFYTQILRKNFRFPCSGLGFRAARRSPTSPTSQSQRPRGRIHPLLRPTPLSGYVRHINKWTNIQALAKKKVQSCVNARGKARQKWLATAVTIHQTWGSPFSQALYCPIISQISSRIACPT